MDGRKYRENYVRDKDAEADDSLAQLADLAAEVLGVVIRLSGKGRDPDNGEQEINC